MFHPVIKGVSSERLEALFEKRDILRSPHKTAVRYGMNKGLRVFDYSLFHQIGPELTGKIELGVNLQSLGNVDAAIGSLRRVIQFTKRSVAGACVVPCIRTL